jgi:hypothetical protein
MPSARPTSAKTDRPTRDNRDQEPPIGVMRVGQHTQDDGVAVRMNALMTGALGHLRVHPMAQWVGAMSGGVAPCERALTVWEPGVSCLRKPFLSPTPAPRWSLRTRARALGRSAQPSLADPLVLTPPSGLCRCLLKPRCRRVQSRGALTEPLGCRAVAFQTSHGATPPNA